MEERALTIQKDDNSQILYEAMVQGILRANMEQEIYSLLMEIPMLSRKQMLLYFGEDMAVYTVSAINHLKKKKVLILAEFMKNDDAEEYYMLRRNDLHNLVLEKPNPYINPGNNRREAVCLYKSFWVYLDFKRIGMAANFARETSRYDFFTMVFEMNHTTYDVLFLEKGRDYVQTFAMLKALEKNYDDWDKDHIHRILLLEERSQLEEAKRYDLINGLEFYALLDSETGHISYIQNKNG